MSIHRASFPGPRCRSAWGKGTPRRLRDVASQEYEFEEKKLDAEKQIKLEEAKHTAELTKRRDYLGTGVLVFGALVAIATVVGGGIAVQNDGSTRTRRS